MAQPRSRLSLPPKALPQENPEHAIEKLLYDHLSKYESEHSISLILSNWLALIRQRTEHSLQPNNEVVEDPSSPTYKLQ